MTRRRDCAVRVIGVPACSPDSPIVYPVAGAVAAVADQGSADLIVRLKPGFVRETRRTSHLVPIGGEQEIPEVLITRCGVEIQPGTADVLPQFTGMPCVTCLVSTPESVAGPTPEAQG